MTVAAPHPLPPGFTLEQAIAQHQAGRLQEAEQIYRAILQAQPAHPDANHNLGVLAAQSGQYAASLPYLKEALAIDPLHEQYALSYAEALLANGQAGEALSILRAAIQRGLDTPATQALLQRAEAATRNETGSAEAHFNLGVALKARGQLVDALVRYRRALEIKPDFLEAHYNLGNALRDVGQLDNAVASYRRALEIKPDYIEAHNNLGNALSSLGQFDDAAASFRRVLELDPDFVLAHSNLGNVLRDLGQLDSAASSYRRALEIKPDFEQVHSNLLLLYSYNALIDPLQYLAQANTWELACVPAQDRQAARHRVFKRSALPGRRLRVGYVSGDFRRHAVSYFMEQLFDRHDRARIELFAYSTGGQRDAVTQRLEALAEHWIPVAGIADAEVRARIEADGIDVLIDLSGHTGNNRLGVFARRAAPVQVHYLGYFASTGLTEMDYFIGDEVLTPAWTDSHFRETVWRLPRLRASYDATADAPVPAWRPSQDGTVWLGSFNNLGKLTPATVAIWAKALQALPEGKLLLKTSELGDTRNRQRVLDDFAGHGISPDRIELQDRSATLDWPAHMASYDRLDIALDPVGAHGGYTTTCDALWMGAPVITMAGNRMASRMATSILNAIGRPEWIAHSEAEYVDKVVALALDVGQRQALRTDQRRRIANSPLCDAHGLARTLEDAYSEMFERWLSLKN